MGIYNKIFKNLYPNGWKNDPNTETPITAKSLNPYNDTFRHIEDYLSNNEIPTATNLYNSNLGDVWTADFNPNLLENRHAVKTKLKPSPSGLIEPYWSVEKVPKDGELIMPTTPNTNGFITNPSVFSNLVGGYYYLEHMALLHYRFDIISTFTTTTAVILTGMELNPKYDVKQQMFAVRESDGQLASVKFTSSTGTLTIYKEASDMVGTWNLSFIVQGE